MEQRALLTLIVAHFLPYILCELTTEDVIVHTEEIVSNSSYTGRSHEEIKEVFEKHRIIPDLVDVAPQYELSVRYVGGVWPDFGTKHTPDELRHPPFAVRFPTIPHVLYSLFMLDLDSPSRKNPTNRAYYHWGLANIPKYNLLAGEPLAQYVGPFPENGTGEHRYVFLVYKQPSGKIVYSEPRLLHSAGGTHRAHWDLRLTVEKYSLEGPVAGNFLYSEWHPPSEDLYRGYTIIKDETEAIKNKTKNNTK